MARNGQNSRLPQVASRYTSLVLLRLDSIAKRRWRRRRLIGPRDAAFSTLRPKLVSDPLRCGLLRFHSPFLTHYEALKDTEQQSKLTVHLIARTLPFLTLVSCPRLRSHVLKSAQLQALMFNLLQRHSRLDPLAQSIGPPSFPVATEHTI